MVSGERRARICTHTWAMDRWIGSIRSACSSGTAPDSSLWSSRKMVRWAYSRQALFFRKLGERFSQNVDSLEFLRVIKQVFTPRAGAQDVNGRKDAFFHQAAVEVELHVSGAFEFLENELVHAALGIDEGGGEDGEAAVILGVAGGAEKPFRHLRMVQVSPTRCPE